MCDPSAASYLDCAPFTTAATSHDNSASQRVLVKAGFVPDGPADPPEVGGKAGTWYQRDLEVQFRDRLI